ncbi:hypothetical protein BH10ACI4_BH10ACI4_10700 [soil metagenome]
MKLLRFLLTIALACGLVGTAKANQLDFHMVVLDPFATTPIFTTPFSFTFDNCVQGQLPTNVVGSYEGCFSGVNRTGQDWIGLQLVFSNTAPLGSQPAGCALDGSTDYFQLTSCTLSTDQTTYILNFTSGAIPNNGAFTIAEDGVDPDLFPLISASVVTASTPEPESIWLLSTGVMSMGSFLYSRRRSAAKTGKV